jgi:hypothetical protein
MSADHISTLEWEARRSLCPCGAQMWHRRGDFHSDGCQDCEPDLGRWDEPYTPKKLELACRWALEYIAELEANLDESRAEAERLEILRAINDGECVECDSCGAISGGQFPCSEEGWTVAEDRHRYDDEAPTPLWCAECSKDPVGDAYDKIASLRKLAETTADPIALDAIEDEIMDLEEWLRDNP